MIQSMSPLRAISRSRHLAIVLGLMGLAPFAFGQAHDVPDGCPGSGSCYEAHGGTGCDNEECCAIVCEEIDPFCCSVEWDDLCAVMADQLCTDLGEEFECPGPDSCYTTHSTRGCNNPDCCETVCDFDEFCCANYWDEVCVALAREMCDVGDAGFCTPNGDCYTANPTPGCNNAECCETICEIDPFCCAVRWDDLCAQSAVWICSPADQCPTQFPCDSPGGPGGCNDPICCARVCAADYFCCQTEWDVGCVEIAALLCDGVVPQTCFPACGKQNVECLAESDPAAYENRTFVGRLQSGGGSCTAWIIAEPNILMTNEHCSGGIVNGQVIFNDECSACVNGEPKQTESFRVTELIFANPDLDYAIFRVQGDPASTYGVASIDPTLPSIGDPIYELHHGAGAVKGADYGNVTSIDEPGVCAGGGTDIEIGIDTISIGGSSGSPLFNANSHCVIGICHCGFECGGGWGIPISAIMAEAQGIIEGAGGVLNFCATARLNPCEGDNDGDFRVTFNDLNRVLDWWGTARPMGDVNNDQVVDFVDLNIVLDNFGRNCLGN